MPGWSCDPHPGSIEEIRGPCVASAGGGGESGFVVSPDILFGPRGGRKGKTGEDNLGDENAHAATFSFSEEARRDESAGGDSCGSLAGVNNGANPAVPPVAQRTEDARPGRIESVSDSAAGNGGSESESQWAQVVNGSLTETEEKRNMEAVIGRSEALVQGGQRGAMDNDGWKDDRSSSVETITAVEKMELGARAVLLSNGGGDSTKGVSQDVEELSNGGTSGDRAALTADDTRGAATAGSGDLGGRTAGSRPGSAERSLSSSSSTSSTSSGLAVDADGARKGWGSASAYRARKGGGLRGIGGGGRMGSRPIMGGANGVLPGGGRGPPLMMGPGMGPPPSMYPMVPDFMWGGMMGMYGPPPPLPPPPGAGPGGVMAPMVANHHHYNHHHPYMMQQVSPRNGMGLMGGGGMLGGRMPPPQLPPPPGAFAPPVLGPAAALGQHTLRYPFGQIIGCTEGTLTMYQQMPSFLLPSSMLLATSQILPGACALFVFNVDTQQIHGYFRSTSHGWEQRLMQTYDGLVPTPMLAANIAFEVVEDFAQPLVRADYQPVFGPSWVDRWQLPVFLSPIQVEQLLLLFEAKKAHASAEHLTAAPPLQSGPQTSQPLPPSALPAFTCGAAEKGGVTNGQNPSDLPEHVLAPGKSTPPVLTTNGGQNASTVSPEDGAEDNKAPNLDGDDSPSLSPPEATSKAAPPCALATPPGDGATSASASSDLAMPPGDGATSASASSALATPPGDGATSASARNEPTEPKSSAAEEESKASPPPSGPPMASDAAKIARESEKSPQQQGTPGGSPGAGASTNGVASSGDSTPGAPLSPMGLGMGRGLGASGQAFVPVVLTPPRKKAGGGPTALAGAAGEETVGTGGCVAGAEVSRHVSRTLLSESPPFFPKQLPTTLPEGGEHDETTKRKSSDTITAAKNPLTTPKKLLPKKTKTIASDHSFPVVELPQSFSPTSTTICPITFGAFAAQERSSCDHRPDAANLVQITFGSFPPVTANADVGPRGDGVIADVAEKKQERVESPAVEAKGVEAKALSVEMLHLFPLLFAKKKQQALDPTDDKPDNTTTTTTTDWRANALPSHKHTKANKAPPPSTPIAHDNPPSSPSSQTAPSKDNPLPTTAKGTLPPPLSIAKASPPSTTASFSMAFNPQLSVPQARPPPPKGGAAVAFVTPPRGPHRAPLHPPSSLDRYLRPSPSPHPHIFSIPPPAPPTAYALTPRSSSLPLSRSLPPHTLSPSLSPSAHPPSQSPSSPFPLPPTKHALLPAGMQARVPAGTHVGMPAGTQARAPASTHVGVPAGVLTVPVSPTASLASTCDSTASSAEPEQCLFCFERRADFFFLTCKHWGPCVDCHKSGNIVMCRQPQCGLPVTKESLHRVFR